MSLDRAQARLLHLALSPAYLAPLAAEYGHGDPVAGIRGALAEAIELVEAAAPGTLKGIEPLHAFQGVTALELPAWRRLAAECGPQATPWMIEARCDLGVFHVKRSLLRGAVLATVSSLLERDPDLNRARLDGRIWQRHSPEVLWVVSWGLDDLGAVAVDASGCSALEAMARVRSARAQAAQERRHELRPVFDDLVARWTAWGFLGSPGGAMVSDLGGTGITDPAPALIEGNGVPMSVVIGDADFDGRVTLGIAVDHRVFDPEHAGRLHRALRDEVPKRCAE